MSRLTKEDFYAIENWLKSRSVPDSQLPPASTLTGSELVPLLQDGVNKVVSLKHLINRVDAILDKDFYNATHQACGRKMCIKEAIMSVPIDYRKLGFVVAFLDMEGVWNIRQFTGDNTYQWGDVNRWPSLFDNWMLRELYVPDYEDLTWVQDGNQKTLKLMDRQVNKTMKSGKGYKVLRQNLEADGCNCGCNTDSFKNVITSKDFKQKDTIYLIRYDFDLDDQFTMPPGCELRFEGGTITGGLINLNGCKITGIVGEESDYFINVKLSNYAKGQLMFREGTMQYYNGQEWKTLTTE